MALNKSLRTNQNGLVSIVVTLIIMIILSLIVLGFAQLARREQRETLDRQLAAQALYAAESGINDANKLMKEQALAGVPDYEKSSCSPETGYDGSLETSNNVQYTCMLIKRKLTEYRNQNVLPSQSTVVPIDTNVALNSVTLHWQNKAGAQSIAPHAFPTLTSASAWGPHISPMRIDLVPASTMSRADFAANSFTFFAYPVSSGTGTVTYSAAAGDQGKIVQADCTTTLSASRPKLCKITINGLSGSKFFVRLKPVYNVSDVEMCYNLCDGTVTNSKPQVEIDVTGRANDVLKRIQIRQDNEEDTSNSADKQDFVLESADSICKLISTVPGPAVTVIDPCPN